MPYYDYKCNIHGVFEVQQSIKSDPLHECPKCKQEGIFEYHCKSCDNSWIFSEKSEVSIVNCFDCKDQNVEKRSLKPTRLISLGSFVLKGGGWANTGYK